MNNIAVNYAVLRFCPYVDTAEFVNVGVVAYAPETGAIGYKLDYQVGKRVRAFFPELDLDVFKFHFKRIKDNLEFVAGIDKNPNNQTFLFSAHIKATFEDIVRTREGVFIFGQVKTILVPTGMDDALNLLVSKYVHRQFAKKREYQEQILEKAVRDNLTKWGYGEEFREERLGDDTYSIKFPFVRTNLVGGLVQKVIKPVSFQSKSSTDIFQSADKIISMSRRLVKGGAMPLNSLILAASGTESSLAFEAVKELTEAGISVVETANESELRRLVEA